MADELLALIWGYRLSQAIHVVAVLGIADLLASGPRTPAELASATNSDADTLNRVLHALVTFGVLHEDELGAVGLTELGDRLRSDVPGSLRDVATGLFRPPMWQAWGNLDESVRTGENAFRLTHGVDLWTFCKTDPEERLAFDLSIMALTRTATGAIIDAYDFAGAGTVVDVAGGRGALIEAIVSAEPAVTGVLFDQPHVVADIDLGPRVRVVGGSFFESVPEGGDVYLLKWILHDFNDEPAVDILRTIRRAISEDRRLLVIERDWASPETALSDLNMLVTPGGRERTREQYAALLAAAGFALARAIPTAGPLVIFEALPV